MGDGLIGGWLGGGDDATPWNQPNTAPAQPNQPNHAHQRGRILEALGRYTGQLPAAQLLYARALYLNGSLDAASRKVRCMRA